MMINFELKNKKFLIFLLVFVVLALGTSICFFSKSIHGVRKTFIFPSVEEGKLVVEARRLPRKVQDLTDTPSLEIEYYVRELLLGPQTERCGNIFPRETKLLSCFLKNKVLYVDFSADIINPEKTAGKLPLKKSVDLFCDNIKRNFSSVSQVEVYVNGNRAYE